MSERFFCSEVLIDLLISWISELLQLLLSPFSEEVDVSCLAVFKRKSRVLDRFWWNWVSEPVLYSLFWKKEFVKFWLIFRLFFATKTIGGSHWVDIGEICADNTQKSQKTALFMRPGSASVLPIYSPGHGDNLRYPNLEKIPRITGSGCF